MTIAITGATGFIGAALGRALSEEGRETYLLARRPPADGPALDDWSRASRHWCGDLSVQRPNLAGVDTLFHFAADMGGVGYFSDNQVAPYVANSRMTFNVLEACEFYGVNRVFLASSACAYPTRLQRQTSEAPKLHEDLLDTGTPDQMYGREKLAMIQLAENVTFDCRVGVLHTVYGDTHDRGPNRNKFPTAVALKAITAAETGRISLWGNGKQLRSYLWIDDAVRKIRAVMDHPDNVGPVNIGFEGALSTEEVATLCCSHLGIEAELDFQVDRPGGVAARDCSNQKFTAHFGSTSDLSARQGFGRLIDRLRSTSHSVDRNHR